MEIEEYTHKVIELFKSGKATDEQYKEMADAVYFTSEDGDTMYIDKSVLTKEKKWKTKKNCHDDQKQFSEAILIIINVPEKEGILRMENIIANNIYRQE